MARVVSLNHVGPMRRLLPLLAAVCLFSCTTGLRAQGLEARKADSLLRAVGAQRLPVEFPNGIGTFADFYAALDAVIRRGEGKIDIVHCGGSHVQAGAYGQAMRHSFESYAPSVLRERGLVVPWEAAGTHASQGAEFFSDIPWHGGRIAVAHHEGPFGGTGMRGTATVAGDFGWSALHPTGSPFTCDRILLLGESEGWQPVWAGPPSACPSSEYKPGVGWEFTLCEPVREVRFTLVADTLGGPDSSVTRNAFHLHGAILGSTGQHGVVWHELGVNGASTAGFLRAEGFEPTLAELGPELVIFGLGINDAHGPASGFDAHAFEKRYDQLIASVKTAAPRSAILLLTNTDSAYKGRSNPNAEAVRDAMFRLGERHGVAVFDQYRSMGGSGSIHRWKSTGLAQTDLVHFTSEGYRVLARLLFDALLAGWGDSVSPSVPER